MKALTAAAVALHEAGIPDDIVGLLIRGCPRQGIPPLALEKALRAAEGEAAKALRGLEFERTREGVRAQHLFRAVAVAAAETLGPIRPK